MSTIDLAEVAGAKATHKFARLSASKARVVLDLIRDEDVDDAADILQFTNRGAADVVAKVLNSAVANAVNNEGLDEDELYVAECFANEGPTLKRWRPRARGRATRINKQTCHITVVVARLDDEELEAREAAGSQAQRSGADRRARVAASRAAEGIEDVEDVESADGGDDAAVEDLVEDIEEIVEDAEESAEEATEPVADADSDGEADDVDASPYGPGSAAPLEDGSAPEGYTIKGNADSMKYHEPDGRWYESTIAEVWFDTVEAAEAAGFVKAGTRVAADENEADEEGEA